MPEYFGYGTIGKIWIDPKTQDLPKAKQRWFCDIIEYVPFVKSVPSKSNGVSNFEKIAENRWSVAARNISEETFLEIVKHAQGLNEFAITKVESIPLILPDLKDVHPTLSTNTLKSVAKQTKNIQRAAYIKTTHRRTKNAKIYGDRAEEIVFEYLRNKNVDRLKWVAKDGDKPGWDIEYFENENLIAIEVKGTSGKQFLSVDITSNEWDAAIFLGARYHLALVTECLSIAPNLEFLINPYKLYENGQLEVQPSIYKLFSKGLET